MLSLKLQKMLVAGGVLLVLAYLGYQVFLTTAVVEVDSAQISSATGQDILDLLEKVNTISINQAIFKSDLFTNLVDFEAPIIPEPTGRENPFAGIIISQPAGFSKTMIPPSR